MTPRRKGIEKWPQGRTGFPNLSFPESQAVNETTGLGAYLGLLLWSRSFGNRAGVGSLTGQARKAIPPCRIAEARGRTYSRAP
jgi:hypothetical protein